MNNSRHVTDDEGVEFKLTRDYIGCYECERIFKLAYLYNTMNLDALEELGHHLVEGHAFER